MNLITLRLACLTRAETLLKRQDRAYSAQELITLADCLYDWIMDCGEADADDDGVRQ